MAIRKKLRARDHERFRIRARVERFSAKIGWRGARQETVLFKDVTDVVTNEVLTDHMWFRTGKWAEDLRAGDIVTFDARVTKYSKGNGHKFDWRMERPTKLVIHARPTPPATLVGQQYIA